MLIEQIDAFMGYLRAEKNASYNTIQSYQHDLDQFRAFLKKDYNFIDNNDNYLEYINTKIVRSFITYLADNNLSRASIARKISTLRSFIRFLSREELIKTNPLASISSPKKEKRLPRFLYQLEINALLEAPDTSKIDGARDYLIIELLYSTGVRVSELVGLNVQDVDLEECIIKVKGKGDKERIVPFGSKARLALQSYLNFSRINLVSHNPQEEAGLILNKFGKRLSARSVRNILNKYVKRLALKHNVSPHVLRHTFATHLLNAGADLRSVQELLGHEKLSTTQIYTHLTKEKLKSIHNNAHPRR